MPGITHPTLRFDAMGVNNPGDYTSTYQFTKNGHKHPFCPILMDTT